MMPHIWSEEFRRLFPVTGIHQLEMTAYNVPRIGQLACLLTPRYAERPK